MEESNERCIGSRGEEEKGREGVMQAAMGGEVSER
jgi:hypothetical protein